MRRLLIILTTAIAVAAGVFAYRASTSDQPEATTTITTAGVASSTTSATPESTTVGDYAASFIDAACEFQIPSGADVRCGYLRVPENRSDVTNGRTVEIHAAVFAATVPSPKPDPIVYLDGGPGGFTLEPLEFSFSSVWEQFLGDRDLVMFDQRGTGYSNPTLECPEDRELTFELLDEDLDTHEYQVHELSAVTECRDRLAGERVDFTAYNSAENAADVGDLMRALGYDEWNLFGISYGTRLAQTVMRDHPEGVRSVVLDSVYTPDVDLTTAAPANLDRALDTLFRGCAEDTACAEAYPNLEGRFFALVERLDESPLSMSIRDVFTQARYDAILDGDTLLGTVFQGLYSSEVIPVLPQMIDELEDGDTSTAALLATNDLANGAFFSLGMNLSVQCNEEIPFSSPDAVAAADDPYPQFGDFFEGVSNLGPGVFDLCEVWQAGVGAPVENEPVDSDIPTLVMSGEYDPITPPEWGQLAANELSNGRLLLFPGVGHGVTVSADCPRQVMFAFLDAPNAEPDVACMSRMGPPEFVVPGAIGEPIVLVPFTEEIFGFGFSGVRPESWESVGPGAWVRGNTGIDQTAVIQQAVPGLGEPSFVVDLFATQIGFDEPAVEAGTFEAGGRTWQLFEAAVDGFPIDVAAVDFDGTVAVIMLVSDASERDALRAEVFFPAMEAFATP